MPTCKDYMDTSYTNLYTIIDQMYHGWDRYKKTCGKRSLEQAVRAYASFYKNSFHSPIAPGEFRIYGLKRVNLKKWIEDEIFGRTNIARQVAFACEAGYSFQQTVEHVKLLLWKCHLPKEKYLCTYIDKNNKTVKKEINLNGALKQGLQIKLPEILWTKEFIEAYFDRYLEFLKQQGFDPTTEYKPEG